MKEKELLALSSACSTAKATGSGPKSFVAAPPAARVNAMLGLRSNVVALLVADGHHPYLSWVAPSTRAP